MNTSHEEATNFHLPKGKRDSDRLEADIVKLLVDKLEGQTIVFEGKECQLKRFGNIGVDVLGIEGFDHVEFCIKKTGWGRNI